MHKGGLRNNVHPRPNFPDHRWAYISSIQHYKLSNYNFNGQFISNGLDCTTSCLQVNIQCQRTIRDIFNLDDIWEHCGGWMRVGDNPPLVLNKCKPLTITSKSFDTLTCKKNISDKPKLVTKIVQFQTMSITYSYPWQCILELTTFYRTFHCSNWTWEYST